MMTSDKQREIVCQRVFDREQKRWARIGAPPAFLRRLFSFIAPCRTVEGMYIVEHEAADPRTVQCVGGVLRAWIIDRSGMREINPSEVDPGDVQSRWWRRPITRMFVAGSSDQVILDEMEGPQQGTFVHLTVDGEGDNTKLRVKRAGVILGGTAIG
jgi:hypothetical protein